jgi:hypothetical protein
VHVTVTRVKTADQPIENAAIVADEMERWLREIEGFRGVLMLAREGTTLGLTFWSSRELAERHLETRLEFVERMTAIAQVEIEEVLDYELAYGRLGSVEVDISG